MPTTSTDPRLTGKTALVTGASRGIGRGVALALVEAGATVYATGRTIAGADLPATIARLPCDHTDDAQVANVFERLSREAPALDILVNGVWGGYDQMMEDGRFTWPLPFWEQPLWRWNAMMDAGVRAAYVASHHAAQMMVPQRRGLIVHLSHWAAQKHHTAVVLSSHLLHLVEELCTRVLVLRGGEPVALGTLDEIAASRPDVAAGGLEELFLALTTEPDPAGEAGADAAAAGNGRATPRR